MEKLPVMFSSDRPLERAENLKAVWDAYDGEKVFRKGIRHTVAVAQEGYSVLVADEIPPRLVSKGKLKVVFIGHGLTGGKTYGLDSPRFRQWAGSDLDERIDYAICSSKAGVQIMAAQLGLPEDRVLPLGMPRTDAYFRKAKGDGKTGMAGHGRSYLYVPTFRAIYNAEMPATDWEAVDQLLDDDEIVIVKRHMLSHDKLVFGGPKKHVVEVPNYETSMEYLVDCDVLITDYSSIVFDGYLLGKPSVLYAPDHEDYKETRGMYMPYPEWYGSKFIGENDPEKLVALAREALADGLGPVEQAVREFTSDACDGYSARRVADFVKDLYERS